MRNKLYLVGIGPGRPEQMTAQAEAAIERSDVLCGYTVYLDLLKDARLCDPVQKKGKADAYRDGLLAHGGPATDAFLKAWGPERTGVLFKKVLFG